MKLLLAGANGHLGQRFIASFGTQHEIIALVRSPAAAEILIQLPCQVAIVAYGDTEQMARLAQGAEVLINLTGIIKATKSNTYQKAHEQTAAALVNVCQRAGISRILTLGICGSDLAAKNACFASRAAAEAIQLEGLPGSTVLRVPMVLGEGDYASRALLANARRRVALTFRAASLEQPIYAGDVITALGLLLDQPIPGILSLGGPESLSRRALIQRCAEVQSEGIPTVISLPFGLGYAIAWLCELLLKSPPVTRAMLGLLDHDDQIETDAQAQLNLVLTPLDELFLRIGEAREQPR